MNDESERPEAEALERMLDGAGGPTASADNLRGILARHTVRRRRVTGGIAGVVLAAGLGGGVAIGALATTGGSIAASGPPANGAAGAAASPSNTTVMPTVHLPAPGPSSSEAPVASSLPAADNLHVIYGPGAQFQPESGNTSATVAPSAGGSSNDFGASDCTSAACPYYYQPLNGALFPADLQPIFQRSANGVEVRAFRVVVPAFPIVGVISPTITPGRTSTGGATNKAGGSTAGGSTASGVSSSKAGATNKASAVTGSPATASTSNETTVVIPPGTSEPISVPTTASIIDETSVNEYAQPRVALCNATSELLVEVSDAGAVGEVIVPDDFSVASKPLALVSDQVLGTAEGAPMAVLVARAGTGTSVVEARFASGATDTMAVVDGWAVLATTLGSSKATASPAAEAAATVAAVSAAGTVTQQVNLTQAPALALPELCVPIDHRGPLPVSPPSAGKPSASKASAGSGSGTVSPGKTGAVSGRS